MILYRSCNILSASTIYSLLPVCPALLIPIHIVPNWQVHNSTWDDLASTFNRLASVYINQQELTKAINTIDRAISSITDDANLYDTKGEILLMMNDEQGALEMWRKVLEIEPDFVEKLGQYSELYKKLKEKKLIEE